MSIAIIPAKGHSTRFPGKNLAKLGGRTLLEITVGKVRDSGRFERIVVSSDDDDILEEARAAGAEARPRPHELARDPVQVGAVCLHVLDEERQAGRDWPWFGLFLVTNPLIPAEAIARAVDTLHATGARAVASVVPVVHPPQRSLRITDEGRLESFFQVDMSLGSQAHEPLYRHEGGALIVRTAPFRGDGQILGGDVRPLVLSHKESVDIDDPIDLAWAEFLIGRRTP